MLAYDIERVAFEVIIGVCFVIFLIENIIEYRQKAAVAARQTATRAATTNNTPVAVVPWWRPITFPEWTRRVNLVSSVIMMIGCIDRLGAYHLLPYQVAWYLSYAVVVAIFFLLGVWLHFNVKAVCAAARPHIPFPAYLDPGLRAAVLSLAVACVGLSITIASTAEYILWECIMFVVVGIVLVLFSVLIVVVYRQLKNGLQRFIDSSNGGGGTIDVAHIRAALSRLSTTMYIYIPLSIVAFLVLLISLLTTLTDDPWRVYRHKPDDPYDLSTAFGTYVMVAAFVFGTWLGVPIATGVPAAASSYGPGAGGMALTISVHGTATAGTYGAPPKSPAAGAGGGTGKLFLVSASRPAVSPRPPASSTGGSALSPPPVS